MQQLKLGKLPPLKGAVQFRLVDFIKDYSKLPVPPRYFGHERFIPKTDWGMLGNDYCGDCVLAEAAHTTMLWNAMAGKTVAFDTRSVVSDYSAITGYVDGKEETDFGTNMSVAASYRRNVGVADVGGARHKVAAYLEVDAKDMRLHYIALYLFGSVSIGFEFPRSAMDQFNRGVTWTVQKNSPIEGGHCVPLVAKRSRLECVTWGRVQNMSVDFFRTYNDESIVYLSEEMLVNRKSPEGFDYDKLTEYLNALK
jgi:hypothetical protein